MIEITLNFTLSLKAEHSVRVFGTWSNHFERSNTWSDPFEIVACKRGSDGLWEVIITLFMQATGKCQRFYYTVRFSYGCGKMPTLTTFFTDSTCSIIGNTATTLTNLRRPTKQQAVLLITSTYLSEPPQFSSLLTYPAAVLSLPPRSKPRNQLGPQIFRL